MTPASSQAGHPGEHGRASYADGIADFIRSMELEGMQPTEPIAQRLASGELIRFRCEGDGKGRQNGWAILYLDERPAGAFGNYRMTLIDPAAGTPTVRIVDAELAVDLLALCSRIELDLETERTSLELLG